MKETQIAPRVVLTHLEWRLARKESRKARLLEATNGRHGHSMSLSIALDEEVEIDDEADAFYSQPFTPSKIVEWFEGWEENEKITVSSRLWLDNLWSDCALHFRSDYEYVLMSPNTKLNSIFLIPATLADFLTDAKRAGLSLYWKKEVIKEHSFLIV